jgi:hypothetical protein
MSINKLNAYRKGQNIIVFDDIEYQGPLKEKFKGEKSPDALCYKKR